MPRCPIILDFPTFFISLFFYIYDVCVITFYFVFLSLLFFPCILCTHYKTRLCLYIYFRTDTLL